MLAHARVGLDSGAQRAVRASPYERGSRCRREVSRTQRDQAARGIVEALLPPPEMICNTYRGKTVIDTAPIQSKILS
jgi:hypothetical protein